MEYDSCCGHNVVVSGEKKIKQDGRVMPKCHLIQTRSADLVCERVTCLDDTFQEFSFGVTMYRHRVMKIKPVDP